ncbi:MAG TPA: S8 family serine peptidase [Gaiellaceae bacterium]|nr:S8 family serine peptidase [Gaiellaceae bacterium]
MWSRGALTVAVLLALASPARAAAGRPLTVGYDSPAALAGVRVLARIPALRAAVVAPGDAPALRGRPGIRFVEPARRRRHLGRLAEAAPNAVLAAEWEYAATRANLVPASVLRAAAAVTIAVVDTGADVSVPELAAKSPATHDAVTGGDQVHDATGHGTFVASVAAGAASGDTLRGFGGDARLMVVQANRRGEVFDDADEAAAIVWAVDHGARIVNLSIGGAETSRVERDAVAYAVAHGVLLVAAAGNSGDAGNVRSYPAALLGPHGLAVAASTAAGARASFSTAAPYVSIAAPGVRVLGATIPSASRATYPRASLGAVQGVYAYATGTSYAAPQVAGAAALVWAADPSLTADGVVRVLERSASGGGAWNPGTGWGVLDVQAAVAAATNAR